MASPLRYPGGKGKLYRKVKEIIEQNNFNDKTYVEPFAGGFGIGLKLLENKIVNRVILNDFDRHIYNFWFCVLNRTEDLCEAIRMVDVTLDERSRQRAVYFDENSSIFEDGFATLFLNRVNYSGIIKAGAIGGLVQTGKYKIDCRFRKNWLIDCIKKIASMRDRIELFNLDASDLIFNLKERRAELFFNIDPPYVVKGAQLYTNFFEKDDHKKLSKIIKKELANVPWILTYDNNVLVKELYKKYRLYEYTLNHSAGGSKVGKEIVILNRLNYIWA